MTSKGRGGQPSIETKRQLYANAGKRCEFQGCNKVLDRDKLTEKNVDFSIVAHIVASDPNGPRGSKDSHKLSKDIDNLMLLCPEHHKLIDSMPDKYTTEMLRQMKIDKERQIALCVDQLSYPRTSILVFTSPINDKEVKIDNNQVHEAVYYEKLHFPEQYPYEIQINNLPPYGSEQYWIQAEKRLGTNIDKYLNTLQQEPNIPICVFPLAPIPLIAKLGYLLGDKRKIVLFQKHRFPDTWSWKNDKSIFENNFSIEIVENSDGDGTALVLSLTAEILLSRVNDIKIYKHIIIIKAKTNGVDCISTKTDLSNFWHLYQEACDKAKNIYSEKSIDVFPAVPVSAAFSIGSRYMPGAFPLLQIYNEESGFHKSLIIGE